MNNNKYDKYDNSKIIVHGVCYRLITEDDGTIYLDDFEKSKSNSYPFHWATKKPNESWKLFSELGEFGSISGELAPVEVANILHAIDAATNRLSRHSICV